jgi:hypothetical protein
VKHKTVEENKPDFSGMADKWPSEFVAREKVGDFTGGIIHPRTQANLDSLGDGPPEKIRLGRKIAYPVRSYIKWLNERMTAEGTQHHQHQIFANSHRVGREPP